MASQREREEEYYEVIKERLRELFEEKGVSVYLEVTSRGTFSDKLKDKIPRGKEVILLFLKKVAPDITGFVEGTILPSFIVVEVKRGKIELDHIYQLKKYADLFEARFAFLVSLEPIPVEIKRLQETLFLLSKLRCGNIYSAFVLTHFNKNSREFVEWYDENPFASSIYWK